MKKAPKLILKVLAVLLLLVIAIQAYFFVQIWWWVDHNPGSTAFMRHQMATLNQHR